MITLAVSTLIAWLASLAIVVLLVLLITYVVVPYVRLQRMRAASRLHSPQPEEIWVLDEGIMYINAVTPTGVEILYTCTHPATGKPEISQWKDTWEDWQKRLQLRTVYFTGQRRPLGNA